MRNFLRGTLFGALVAYVLHDDLDKAVKAGLGKVNEIVVDKPSEPDSNEEVTPS